MFIGMLRISGRLSSTTYSSPSISMRPHLISTLLKRCLAAKAGGKQKKGKTTTSRPNRDAAAGPNRKKHRPPEMTMQEIVNKERAEGRDYRIDAAMLPRRAFSQLRPIHDQPIRKKLKDPTKKYIYIYLYAFLRSCIILFIIGKNALWCIS